MARSTLSVKQIEYKNAELVLAEFMELQEYDIEEWEMPSYKDFNLQEFHDFIADKIEALDPIIWQKRWTYKKKWQ
jgi:hypothetical protein